MKCDLAAIVESYSRAIHGRDPNLYKHHERVGDLCRKYAEHVRMDSQNTELLVLAARIHDLGKLGVGLNIIDKVTSLTASEWVAILRHPNYGIDYLEPFDVPQIVKDVMLHHHESWDGTGYPDGLENEAIPESARIVKVADAIDAIQHARAYHGGARSASEVIEHLRERSQQYDASVMAVFIEILNAGGKR